MAIKTFSSFFQAILLNLFERTYFQELIGGLQNLRRALTKMFISSKLFD